MQKSVDAHWQKATVSWWGACRRDVSHSAMSGHERAQRAQTTRADLNCLEAMNLATMRRSQSPERTTAWWCEEEAVGAGSEW